MPSKGVSTLRQEKLSRVIAPSSRVDGLVIDDQGRRVALDHGKRAGGVAGWVP